MIENAKDVDDLINPYTIIATKTNRPFLGSLICTQGALRRYKSRLLPKLTFAKLAFYIYSFDISFKYDLASANKAADSTEPLIPLDKVYEAFSLASHFKKLDNAGIKEKQEAFKCGSLLTMPQDPFHVRYEQTGKDAFKAGIRYNALAASELSSKKSCYSCRLKGNLIYCDNCPGCYHAGCEKWTQITYKKDGKETEGNLCEKCSEIYGKIEEGSIVPKLDKKVKFRMPRFPQYHSLGKDCFQMILLNNSVFEKALANYHP